MLDVNKCQALGRNSNAIEHDPAFRNTIVPISLQCLPILKILSSTTQHVHYYPTASIPTLSIAHQDIYVHAFRHPIDRILLPPGICRNPKAPQLNSTPAIRTSGVVPRACRTTQTLSSEGSGQKKIRTTHSVYDHEVEDADLDCPFTDFVLFFPSALIFLPFRTPACRSAFTEATAFSARSFTVSRRPGMALCFWLR